MMRSNLVISICAVMITAAWAALGQVPSPAASPEADKRTAEEQFRSDASKDDILILANVTVKELRFETVPNTRVDFPGTKNRTNIWVTQRQNLPDQVQPGVTYRDVGLQLRISTRFADIEQILRDALKDTGATGTVNGTTPSTPKDSPQAAAPREKQQ